MAFGPQVGRATLYNIGLGDAKRFSRLAGMPGASVEIPERRGELQPASPLKRTGIDDVTWRQYASGPEKARPRPRMGIDPCTCHPSLPPTPCSHSLPAKPLIAFFHTPSHRLHNPSHRF
ncbi:hypothetical protein, partial [Mesorhizobium sp. Root157]|uniref:hypothetical protein n=1 Tax=Mesorhizobium sp. Root157 TaxID=1736477 RepID=UPI001AECD623